MNDTLKSVGLNIVAMINGKCNIFWVCVSVHTVMQHSMTMHRISDVIGPTIRFYIIS